MQNCSLVKVENSKKIHPTFLRGEKFKFNELLPNFQGSIEGSSRPQKGSQTNVSRRDFFPLFAMSFEPGTDLIVKNRGERSTDCSTDSRIWLGKIFVMQWNNGFYFTKQNEFTNLYTKYKHVHIVSQLFTFCLEFQALQASEINFQIGSNNFRHISPLWPNGQHVGLRLWI